MALQEQASVKTNYNRELGVAKELLRQHPPSTDGSEAPLEVEAASCIKRLVDTIKTFREATSQLLPYRSHASNCEIDTTDFCTCGMKEAADAVRAVMGNY